MRAREFITEVTRMTYGRDEWGNPGSHGGHTGRPDPFRMLPVNKIVVHEPDTKFDEPESRDNLEKIKAALRRGEKIEPIIVHRLPGGFLQYQVLDGHHRFRAYRDLGLKKIPAIIAHRFNVTHVDQQGVTEGQSEKMSKTKALNALRRQLMDTYEYMRCANLEEFKQRLQWLSEGMLENHMTGGKSTAVNMEEIELYKEYREKREQIQRGSTLQGVAKNSLNEFAGDSGDDGEEFDPGIAKLAQEDGWSKGVSLSDHMTLVRAMAIQHWHTVNGGMYIPYFADGFKKGRMNKINHANTQYNRNLKLMKDGSIRDSEQGVTEAPRTFQSKSSPLEKLTQAYGYFTTLGNVHLDKQAKTPEARQALFALVQRLNQDGKVFAGLDKAKMERNREQILSHIHDMMTYVIPVLKKNLPADAWEAKRGQINSVLQAYNDAAAQNQQGVTEGEVTEGILNEFSAFHGTFRPRLQRFFRLSHFGTERSAAERLYNVKSERPDRPDKAYIYKLDLGITAPGTVKDHPGIVDPGPGSMEKIGAWSRDLLKDPRFANYMAENPINGQPNTNGRDILKHFISLAQGPYWSEWFPYTKFISIWINFLQAVGIDGLVYNNRVEHIGSKSYVIFHPDQVRVLGKPRVIDLSKKDQPQSKVKKFSVYKTPMINSSEEITESLNKPYPMKWSRSEFGSRGEIGDWEVLAKLPDGTNLEILFSTMSNINNSPIELIFLRGDTMELSGKGDAQRVFATVLAAIQQFIKKAQPETLIFSASKEVEPGQSTQSRSKLYDRLVQRYAAAWGYESHQEDYSDHVKYRLTKKESVKESRNWQSSMFTTLTWSRK